MARTSGRKKRAAKKASKKADRKQLTKPVGIVEQT